MRHAVQLILLLGVLAPSLGCAVLAKKPATPAANLDTSELAYSAPPPGIRQYLIVFGSQSVPKQTRYTHTWAMVVRVTEGSPGSQSTIEQHTISWMPATLDIRPYQFHVERGVNLDNETTIREMLKHDEKIAMWGPYEIGRGTYLRFITQKEFLESGEIGYQCIDSVGESARLGNGCDCIHAVTDLDPLYSRTRYLLAFFGISASHHVVREFMLRPVIYDPATTHDWLIPVLGLDKHPIEHRQYLGKMVPHMPGQPALQTPAARP